jgi:hypothetical protein
MFPTRKTAILAIVLGSSLLTSAPVLAATKDYTCVGLRFCQNFASACLAAGGAHSVDVPSTPGGGPIVNHCRVDESRSGAVDRLRAAGGTATPGLKISGN